MTDPTHLHGVINGLVGEFVSSSRQILQTLASDNKSLSYTSPLSPPWTALGLSPKSFVKFIYGKLSGTVLMVGLCDSLGKVKSLFCISIYDP